MPPVSPAPWEGRGAAPRQAGARPLAAALLALAAGCGSSHTLEGSLGEILPLDFEEAEVAVTENEVVLSYWKPKGEGRDVVFKLVVSIRPGDVVPNQEYELEPLPDGTAFAVCTRAVADDPIHTLAAVRRGRFLLDAAPAVDRPVAGHFRVTLGEGGDAGKGRTVFGDFEVERVVPGS